MAKENDIIRIALIGPESTAKSSLSEELARHYNTVWVPEYSRTYLDQLGKRYTLEDVLNIAKHQQECENELIKKANRIIFADTELIISKVWCEDVFKTCPDWILQNLTTNRYDFYLLTYHDLEWIPDPLRENPHRREFFFNWYLKELEAIGAEYSIIKGSGKERFINAVKAIENFLASLKK